MFFSMFCDSLKDCLFFFTNVSGETAKNIKPTESLSEGLCVSRYLGILRIVALAHF